MLLDLLDHVADSRAGAPILLLCTARPELLDARPGWGGGKLTATTTLLEPLVVKEAEALLEELGDGLDCSKGLDGALGLLERGIETQRGLGLRLPAASQAMSVAKVHMSAGDPAAAADALKRGDAVLAEHGERAWRSTVQAGLARAHAELHDREAALAACDLSDELSAAEDLANYAITHGVRARVALEEGDSEQAQQWANSAVEYAFQTDFPEVQAEAKLELAGVLSALGRRDQALTAAREALAIQEAKGDRPGMAEAQALLDRL